MIEVFARLAGMVAQVAAPAANTAAAAASSTAPAAAAAATTAAPAAPMDSVAAAAAAPAPDWGVVHFFTTSGPVGKALFVVLLVMSVVSWYLIIVKTVENRIIGGRASRFLSRFWSAASLEEVDRGLGENGARDPFSRLTRQAFGARAHLEKYGSTRLDETGSTSEFVTRTMRKVLDEETARRETGLTLLASIGSTAPFVGLFGTVWGVYHALVGIGMSQGVSINQIATPVGEALIMTGLGLAVAIPAVLAYNAFVRGNRVFLSRLDSFAHDLYAFLSTGQQVESTKAKVRALRRSATSATSGA